MYDVVVYRYLVVVLFELLGFEINFEFQIE